MKVLLSVAAGMAALVVATSAAEAGMRDGDRHFGQSRGPHRHAGWHGGRGALVLGALGEVADALASGPAVPVFVAEYREPYIGRGLIYNVPTSPEFASAGWGGSAVVRAKY